MALAVCVLCAPWATTRIVWHMNEGHSGFLDPGTRSANMVGEGNTFEAGCTKIVRKSTVFTTHTPVPAGNDEFPLWLIDKYFSNFWPRA